jgi:ParB family transcriptional regulator, chromosome partitioning protein
MTSAGGHIELDRSIDSITVGSRHRKDPGDLTPLIESIERLGLLQPVTITPEGVLICGWRRLEAVRRLGWRTMKVWVRSGVSDALSLLLAEQDENQLHKPLNELEKASLYRELKALRTEEAERRMQATQFGPSVNGGEPGCGPGPQPGEAGRARSQAALAITGKESYHTHERVCVLMDWASRKATPPEIRAMANDALQRIERGESVKPLFLHVKEAFDKSQELQPEDEMDLARLAREALERAEREMCEKGRKNLKRSNGPSSHFRGVRSFNLTWAELDGWTELYDVDALAAQLTRTDWERFDRVVTATIAFRDQLVATRRYAATSA